MYVKQKFAGPLFSAIFDTITQKQSHIIPKLQGISEVGHGPVSSRQRHGPESGCLDRLQRRRRIQQSMVWFQWSFLLESNMAMSIRSVFFHNKYILNTTQTCMIVHLFEILKCSIRVSMSALGSIEKRN